MKIAILEAGRLPAALEARFGRYETLMAGLLGDGFETANFALAEGELPRREDFGGLLVTGSSAGVYDDLPWIGSLLRFLAEARGRTRMVGICFGHQAMATAFGGRVEKSTIGWGFGLHEYAVAPGSPWLDGLGRFAIAASHQDQVVEPPPGAQVIASSAHTPYAALLHDDASLSFQGHPEFSPDFSCALLDAVHGNRLPPAELERLRRTHDRPDSRAEMGAAIGRFLRGAP